MTQAPVSRPEWADFLDDARVDEKQLVEPNIELMNPYRGYYVYTHNQKFNEEIQGFQFINGRTRIDALQLSSSKPEARRRFELLSFFQNAHKSVLQHEVWNPERRVMELRGSDLVPTYRVEPFDGPVAPESFQRAKPAPVATVRRTETTQGFYEPEAGEADEFDPAELDAATMPDPEQYGDQADLLNLAPSPEPVKRGPGRPPGSAKKL